jgi:4-coumarate--CoA ligase
MTQDVEIGQPGELWVRGPVVTRGYFNNPTATKESFHDGWFCTGDIAVNRGGKFYIVDRKKVCTGSPNPKQKRQRTVPEPGQFPNTLSQELFKYKGLQIAPAELEGVLNTHPKIGESAVVGIPLEDGSEVPRAYVVADSKQISEDEIKDFIAKNLASYKQLRGGVVFVDELPKNAIGKILRRELRDIARNEMKRVSKL